MKIIFCLLLLTTSALAQDPNTYLKNFDNKIYSLKSKGVTDFVVDIESSQITKQLNEQQLFGKVEEVVFRTYWTAKPERLAIEVIGLPEGFREVKEELKMSVLGIMDNLIPMTMAQRFNGYKFTAGKAQREFIANDTTGIAPIPSFILKFNEQDILLEVNAVKNIGSMVIKSEYKKESFADGKWLLDEQKTITSEQGQTLVVTKDLDYDKTQGIGVLTEVEIETEHKISAPESKTVKSSEKITFKNYKINSGDALKYFLGESKSAPAAPAQAPKQE